MVKIGSLTLVMRSASEALQSFDTLLTDDEPCLIADMDGRPIDISELRKMVGEVTGAGPS